MGTPVTNFGKATVSTTYGATETTIVVATGHGSRFPSTFPYPLIWWNATDYPDPADDPNREIVIVTHRTGDTLTVTRGAEGTAASNKNTPGKTYQMLLGITKAMWDAIGDLALSQTFRNLTVRTHPDSDLAANRLLFSADAIVMNDGEEVSHWSNVVIDITASGVGGLDVGTEQPATWYELYAIYNGTTKAGCLHRAKDWFLDLDITAGEDATQGIRSAVDNSTVRVAQGFTPVTAGKVVFLDVELVRVGTPTGTIWFTIEANSGGVPSGTPLATSWKFDVARIPTTAGGTQMRIPFPVPATVSASTLYHVVASGDWTVSASNYIGWRMDGSAATYAGGAKALFNSTTSTWTTDIDDDLWLRVYIERNNVDFATTVPAGYRYAKIGYAYNDGSGNLMRFRQQNGRWRYARPGIDAQAVDEFSSNLQMVDLRTLCPPFSAAAVTIALSGTGSATATAFVGDLTATDIVNGSNVGAQNALRAGGNAETIQDSCDVLLAYNALMVDGTPGADLYVIGFDW